MPKLVPVPMLGMSLSRWGSLPANITMGPKTATLVCRSGLVSAAGRLKARLFEMIASGSPGRGGGLFALLTTFIVIQHF